MKRFYSLLTSLLLVGLLCLNALSASAEAGTALITVGGKTVFEDSTLSEVEARFGAARLITPSAFGGKAAAFYGEEYADYLYLETNAAGKIVCYASFTPEYQTGTSSYGDTEPEYWWGSTLERGYLVSDYDTDKIWAGCYYNASADDVTGYLANWKADSETYLAGLEQQGALMFNALGYVLEGKHTAVSFNPELFLANEQLKETGSSLYDYADATGKSSYVQLISMGVCPDAGRYYMPNPLMYARYARNYNVHDSATYACFDFTFTEKNSENPFANNSMSVYFVDPMLLEEKTAVPLTEEEKLLLQNARRLYARSVERFNAAAADSYFTEEYQFENLPLEAGRMKSEILGATADYLNAIRVGAGLSELKLSDSLCSSAQHKAVLTMYMAANDIDNPNPHTPSQPAGVEDAFYQGTMGWSGENLYHNSILGGDFVIGSIQNALQEAYGDTIACGHRYNLLDPGWTEVGFGSCNGQGVHQFSGHNQEDETEMVAWPSKGIMLVDANYTDYRWTIQFFKNYTLTENSSVTVKNLSSGQIWVEQPGTSDFRILGSNEISFYDSGIACAIGDVCEITVGGLLKNGEPAEFTYRTVFAAAGGGEDADGGAVTISAETAILAPGGNLKLSAKNGNAGTKNNSLIRWRSSDESVATVSPNGRVTAVGKGTAVITAISDADPSQTAACTITVDNLAYLGDLDADSKVTVTDVVRLRAVIVSGGESDYERRVGDLDENNQLTVADVVLLRSRIVTGAPLTPVRL